MRVAILAGLSLFGSAALAQTYPFEGRWRNGGNSCEDGLVITATHLNQPSAQSVCRFTRLQKTNATTFTYALRCNDNVGHSNGTDYTSSGTIQMAGSNRFRQRDTLMRGQIDTYDRC